MEIKKYSLNEINVMRFVKSDAEIRLSAAENGSKGTKDNPYVIGEYISLYLNGMWEGGYVEGIGYVGKDQSSVVFHSSEDWDGYFSDVFSFLNTSVEMPSGISLPKQYGSSKSGDQGYDYSQRTENISCVLGGVFFDIRICIVNYIAIISTTATSYSVKLKDGDFCFAGNGWSVDLITTGYSTDGQNYKYTFRTVVIPYRENEDAILCNKNGGDHIKLPY